MPRFFKLNSDFAFMSSPKPNGQSTGRRAGSTSPGHRDPVPSQWNKIAPYAVISLISFLCGMVVLSLMLWNAEKLAGLGLIGNLYYITLLPLGFSAAGFLFGVLRSFATYHGEHFGGTLELGGPVIGFALVVIGGFFLVKTPETFPLTVYVHGVGGPHEIVLRNSGYVNMDLGADRRREPVGEKGQAYFPAIPGNFRGQEIVVWVESEEFEPIEPNVKRRVDGPSLYLSVRKKNARISGRVQDENGDPVAGASISIEGLSTTTNKEGYFEFAIPGDRVQPVFQLQALASGFRSQHYPVVPNANPVTIQLQRTP